MQCVDWVTVIVALVSAVIATLVTGHFAWRYYVSSSEDLKEQTESLRRRFEELSHDLRQTVLTSQEQLRNLDAHIIYLIKELADAGQIEPRRDEKGNVLLTAGSERQILYNVKDHETEKREREEREKLAQEENEQELSRRPFRGPLHRIRQRLSALSNRWL
jgi:hypothetical protein